MVPKRHEAGAEGAIEAATKDLKSGNEVVLQFASPTYTASLLRTIDGLCQLHGPRVEVRFYGHRRRTFDFEVLREIPHVANLSTDCLQSASNVQVLQELGHLQRLSFGVFDCPDPDFLQLLDPDSIQELWLSENQRRNLNLKLLRDFRCMRTLQICGHTRGLDTLAELTNLEKLRLRMIPKSHSLEFVSELPKLRQLCIILGGRESISEITSESIEELEIVRVRGLSVFPDLAKLRALQKLLIEDQIRLREASFPKSPESPLRHLILINCKELSTIHGFYNLQRLEHLRVSRTALDLEDLLSGQVPPSLEVFAFYAGSQKKNAAARARLDALGYAESSTT